MPVFRVTIPLALVALFVATPAHGQTQQAQSARPYRGVFRAPAAAGADRLFLNVALGGGYDDNVLAGDENFQGGIDPLRGRKSTTGFLQAHLGYSKTGDRGSLSASVGSSTRYYRAIQERVFSRQTAYLNGSWQVASRSRLGVTQQVSYDPSYSLWAAGSPIDPGNNAIDPSLAVDPGTQARLGNRLWTTSGATFDQQLTRRLSFGLDYSFHQSRVVSSDLGLTSQQGGTRLTYLVGRGVGLRIGYQYVESEFGPENARTSYQNHAADVGLNFAQAISLAQGTTLSFGTGIAGVRQQDRTRYRAIGHLQLNRELGLSWNAFIGYSRNVRYIDTFQAPVFSDALGVGVGGLLGRRLGVSTGFGTSRGDLGGQASSDRFRTYYGSAGLTVGIASNVGLGFNYSYNRYDFGSAIVLPAGVPNRVDRQGISVSLQLTPLLSWTGR